MPSPQLPNELDIVRDISERPERHANRLARDERGGPAAPIVDLMMSPQIRCNEAARWGLGVGLEDFGHRRFAWYERVIRGMTGDDHPAFLWA